MGTNTEIARVFNEIADILEIKNENRFRIRAYRRAAQSLAALTEDVSDIARRGELTAISGIGKDLAEKIKEFIGTGKIKFFDQLKKEAPEGILDLMKVPGIGPKKAKLLTENLKIKNIEDLEKKAKSHKLSALPGMREKTEQNILRGIETRKKWTERMLLGTALPLASEIITQLKRLPQTRQIAYCGSLRRQKETVRDIDILTTSDEPNVIMNSFVSLPHTKEILTHGPTKSSIITKEGAQVDIRVVEPGAFGAALLYFTGSKEHNVRLRELAVRKGLKVNEYGVFDVKTRKRLGGNTEEEIYKILGLTFIPPELREDRGEIELAKSGALPRLIGLNDIRGDFHCHTRASDGSNSIRELAEEAMKRGYEYLVITDHSKTLAVAGGLTNKELLGQIKEIKKINSGFKNFRLLAGAEVDIMNDGSLGFEDEILSRLDIVIAAIHGGFKQPKEKITNRIITAMKNRHVNIIAHLTGRLIGERDPYQVDTEQVLRAAGETNTAIEINSFPQRLDIDDIGCKRAQELGVMIAISTDTHIIPQLDNMKYGISVARRGWLEKKDVLNTYSAEQALKKLKK